MPTPQPLPANDLVDLRDSDGKLLFRFSPTRRVVQIKHRHGTLCEVDLGPLLQSGPITIVYQTVINEAAPSNVP